MDYSFRYSLSIEDLAEYNVYTAWHAPWMKKARMTYLMRTALYSAVSFAAITIIMQYFNPIRNTTVFFVAAAIMLVVTVFFSHYQAPFSVLNKARKIFAKEENKHMLNETILEMNEQGIIATDKDSRTQLTWASIMRYAVTREYFYLYLNSIQAHIVPKRLFTSQKEMEAFDRFLSEKIPLAASFRSMGF
jgi:hypothetical protein